MKETKYYKVAVQMLRDYNEILKLIENNNGKIPSQKLKEKYNIDSSAAREIFLGIYVTRNQKNF